MPMPPQEQQLHRKASQLGAIEEERFETEKRRRAARSRFEQEQALAAVVSERRRRLAAERVRFLKEKAEVFFGACSFRGPPP